MSKFKVGDFIVSRTNKNYYIEIIAVNVGTYDYIVHYVNNSLSSRRGGMFYFDTYYDLSLKHMSPVYQALMGVKHE